jgi:hypothetical protein
MVSEAILDVRCVVYTRGLFEIRSGGRTAWIRGQPHVTVLRHFRCRPPIDLMPISLLPAHGFHEYVACQ